MDTNSKRSDAVVHCVHFDEFKVFLESAERITDRRLDLNKTNVSICLLITTGIGGIFAWAHDKAGVFPFALIVTALIATLAAVFCRWWWKQIESYKDLNDAKFKVLNAMAPLVVFSNGDGKTVKSYEPFTKEWEILKSKNALQRYKSGLALGASWSEITVPKSFLFLYAIIFVFSVCVFLMKCYRGGVLIAMGILY